MTTRRFFLQQLPLVGLAGFAKTGLAAADEPATTGQRNQPNIGLPGKDDWTAISALFTIDQQLAYFNAGGLGPAPATTIKTVCDTIRRLQRTPEHGHEIIDNARPLVAKFLGAKPNEIAFTRNATEGNSTIAAGLQLSAGDEVIIDSHAHQGGSVTWMTRQKYDRVHIRAFDPLNADETTILQRIADQITPRTRVLQVSHVTAPTGIRLPVQRIAQLAHDHKLWFHIDGAQSAGMFPIALNALGCDSYATSGHKWLCGPTGTGLLYVKHERLDEVQPTDAGSYADRKWRVPSTLEFVNSARRFECGTRDAATVAGLAESVKLFQHIGVAQIEQRCAQLADLLRDRLEQFDDATLISPSAPLLRTPMVTFTWKHKSANELYSHCRQHHCRCRPVREQHLQALRVSLHLFNSERQLDTLTDALNQLI